MKDLLATFNVSWALAQGHAVGDLSPVVSSAGIALSLLPLTTKVLPLVAALGLVSIYLLVKHVVFHGQRDCDLLGAPMQSQQGNGLFFHPECWSTVIATLLRAYKRQFTGLIRAIPARPCIAAQLAADRGLVASDQAGDLSVTVLGGIYKAANLVFFNLAKVFVIHRANSTCRFRNLQC